MKKKMWLELKCKMWLELKCTLLLYILVIDIPVYHNTRPYCVGIS